MTSLIEVSVVIPVYNNAGSLAELSARLLSALTRSAKSFEIIFIDDGSRDNSGKLLSELAKQHETLKVILLSRNFGQHPAICAGFEHARGEITILMDADLQDSPEDIPNLLAKLETTHSDIVYTIKKTTDKLISSRLSSALYHYIFSKIVKTKVPVNIGTFRAFNRKVLEALLQFKEVNVLYGPLMFYLGFNSCFLELPYLNRPVGKSSYTFWKRLQLAVNSLISYTDIPHKISVLFGSLLLGGSFFYALAVVAQYFMFGASLPEGSTLILLVLCLTLGSIMMFLGIIGSYIFRVYQEVLKRPRYLIQEKINFTGQHE
jgi:dolichol-phosphate mannosyltransferase